MFKNSPQIPMEECLLKEKKKLKLQHHMDMH